MSHVNCCICDQIEGNPSHDLLHAHFGGGYQRRVRDVGPRLSIIPSLGSLVPGHLLLCPNAHVRSLAQLSTAHLQEINRALHTLTPRLALLAGGDVQLFEHGDAKTSNRTSCSVEHAHLHLVPAVPDLSPVAKDLADWRSVAGLDGLAAVVGDHEYLALRARTGGWRVAMAPPGGHPSQLLRQLVAQALGDPARWNWRQHPALATTAASWRIAREVVDA